MRKTEEYVQTSIICLAKKLLKDLNILMDLLNSSVGYKTLYFKVYNNDKCNLMKNESYMQPLSPALMQYLNYKILI